MINVRQRFNKKNWILKSKNLKESETGAGCDHESCKRNFRKVETKCQKARIKIYLRKILHKSCCHGPPM